MAGHSHWAGIKHKKAREDAKRGKIFSKCARAITVAARQGGGDPAMNLTLRYAIDDARAANMPKDNIERAIKKGTGELEGETIEECAYEGYGPGGVAIFVEAMTDNRTRTSNEISRLFDRHGGNMGQPGCVGWMFSKKGLVTVPADAAEETVMEVALSAGAEDMAETDDGFEITTPPEVLADVREALEGAGVQVETAHLAQIPQTYVSLAEDDARKVLALMEELDDHDDVQNVHSNFDIDAELLEKIQAG